jgi:spore maturation protein B
MDVLVSLISPLFDRLGIPSEVLPLGLLRPLTGAGSLAFTTELIKTFGPDSMIGRIASTIQGSTDTTLYVLTVYFGAVGVRKSRYALKVGLFSDLVGFAAAIIICLFVFG